jgi:hypothetical protein
LRNVTLQLSFNYCRYAANEGAVCVETLLSCNISSKNKPDIGFLKGGRRKCTTVRPSLNPEAVYRIPDIIVKIRVYPEQW